MVVGKISVTGSKISKKKKLSFPNIPGLTCLGFTGNDSYRKFWWESSIRLNSYLWQFIDVKLILSIIFEVGKYGRPHYTLSGRKRALGMLSAHIPYDPYCRDTCCRYINRKNLTRFFFFLAARFTDSGLDGGGYKGTSEQLYRPGILRHPRVQPQTTATAMTRDNEGIPFYSAGILTIRKTYRENKRTGHKYVWLQGRNGLSGNLEFS